MKMADLKKLNDEGFERKSVQWAVDKHADKSLEWKKVNEPDSDYAVVWVNIKDLMSQQDREHGLDLYDPTGGENSIGDRVRRAKSHWASGGHMDPVRVAYNDWHNSITIGDGRHRLVAAFQGGHRYAPVVIPKDDLKYLKKLGIKTKEDKK